MLEESVTRASRRSGLAVAAVVFAVAGFPLLRPNILGERFAAAGLALVLVAGFFVLLQDRGRATWGRPSTLLIVLLGFAQAWAVFRAPYNGIGVVAMITGSITTLTVLVVFAFLLSSAERTRMFLRALVVGIVILCASSLITAALAVAGVRIELFSFPITDEVAATVYFPFTATSGIQSVFGIQIPRFTGLGREPGWMAMYAAVAWLIWPRLFGSRFRLWRLLLVAGVLTPLSTAGFGIFVVVAAFDLFLRPRPGSGIVIGYARQVTGVAVLVFAVWLAVAAPVLGLEAKSVQNVASLDERNAATLDGLRALQELSLGEESASRIPGVNLIAAVAETGWPYSLLVALAIVLPLMFRTSRRHAIAPIGVIFLTLLLAQPPGESTTVFVLVAGVYALADLPDDPPAAVRARDARAPVSVRPRPS